MFMVFMVVKSSPIWPLESRGQRPRCLAVQRHEIEQVYCGSLTPPQLLGPSDPQAPDSSLCTLINLCVGVG